MPLKRKTIFGELHRNAWLVTKHIRIFSAGPNQSGKAKLISTKFSVECQYCIAICITMDFSATCHPAPGKVDLIEEYTYGPKKCTRNSCGARKRTM